MAFGECRMIMRPGTVVREVPLRPDNLPVPHHKEGHREKEESPSLISVTVITVSA